MRSVRYTNDVIDEEVYSFMFLIKLIGEMRSSGFYYPRYLFAGNR